MIRKFRKEKSKWYIVLPLWPGPKAALEMVAGADDLLDRVSENSNEVTIEFSSSGFEGYDDVLERVGTLKELDDESKDFGYFDGAIYSVKHKPIKNSIIEPNQLWLCGVTLFVFLKYPKKIYFKKVETK